MGAICFASNYPSAIYYFSDSAFDPNYPYDPGTTVDTGSFGCITSIAIFTRGGIYLVHGCSWVGIARIPGPWGTGYPVVIAGPPGEYSYDTFRISSKSYGGFFFFTRFYSDNYDGRNSKASLYSVSLSNMTSVLQQRGFSSLSVFGLTVSGTGDVNASQSNGIVKIPASGTGQPEQIGDMRSFSVAAAC